MQIWLHQPANCSRRLIDVTTHSPPHVTPGCTVAASQPPLLNCFCARLAAAFGQWAPEKWAALIREAIADRAEVVRMSYQISHLLRSGNVAFRAER